MDEVRDLGVTISADLSWKSHIGSMVAEGKSSAAWVLSVFRSREPDMMMTLYKTYVRSQLEYCSVLWHPHCIEDLGVVEGVQRALTSKMFGLRLLGETQGLASNVAAALAQTVIVIMMCKLFHDIVPNDLNIQFHDSGWNDIKAVLPSYPRGCRITVTTQFNASFAYVGPKVWNMLPSYSAIRELDEFQRKLTGFVLLLLDKPPIPG